MSEYERIGPFHDGSTIDGLRKQREPYRGKIGPADAMSALTPEFDEAYRRVTQAIDAAVLEFEQTTGRVVDSIDWRQIDISTVNESPKYFRGSAVHFLPTPGEVAW